MTSGCFAFRRELTRQAVYGDLLGRERRTVHGKALVVLEQFAKQGVEVATEELAYHAHAAGDWCKTAIYAELAGEHALAMHAPLAAVEHFGRAIEAAEKLTQPASLSVKRGRGQAYYDLGQFDLARADFEAVLTSATAARDTGTGSGNGEALGTLGLREPKLRQLATEAGFSSVRRIPMDNPFNNLYELTR